MVEKLQQLESVVEIYQDELLPRVKPLDEGDEIEGREPDEIEWGLESIQAPKVWEMDCRGQGVKIGSIDTGAQWDHEALIDNYVGNARYGWFNPYKHATPDPIDTDGHGTHTIGTMVGKFGIGVAPEAEWMACLACSVFGCLKYTVKKCAEFMLCPHDAINHDQVDCSLAPNIISNSWSGGQGETWFDSIIEAWRDANIIPVFAMGNNGKEGCGTANSPGDNPNVIAVGATTSSSQIAWFSSRGPAVGNDSIIKPDLVAPGEDILSAVPSPTSKRKYRRMSGTSMACPHVSGAIALILSENPSATSDQVLQIMTSSTKTSGLISDEHTCGQKDSFDFPNFVFGNGLLDTYNCWKQTVSSQI